MKGVVLAGGSGSRLGHLTKITNKHLLPVGKYPMIYYPISKLVAAGITEIMVVTGCEHIGSIVGYLGSGHEFNCDITYKVQDKAGGIAEALYLAEDFAAYSDVCVILGDNIFSSSLESLVSTFNEEKQSGLCKAMITLYGLDGSAAYKHRFGVAFLEKNGFEISSIVEKPTMEKLEEMQHMRSGVVTGIYFYDHSVFEKIRMIEYSARGEKEITDVNNLYLAENRLLGCPIEGKWTDAGTHESLLRANELMESVQ